MLIIVRCFPSAPCKKLITLVSVDILPRKKIRRLVDTCTHMGFDRGSRLMFPCVSILRGFTRVYANVSLSSYGYLYTVFVVASLQILSVFLSGIFRLFFIYVFIKNMWINICVTIWKHQNILEELIEQVYIE